MSRYRYLIIGGGMVAAAAVQGLRDVDPGCVLASTDPAALDITTARLLGFSDEQATSMTYAGEAARRGLCTMDPAQIAVRGASLDAVRRPVQQIPLDLTFGYVAPVRVIVGAGVSVPGTIGHFKSVADITSAIPGCGTLPAIPCATRCTGS